MGADTGEYAPGRGEPANRRKLSRLIDQGLVAPVFQPIVNLQQASIGGLEALTRPGPDSGFDSPDSLFAAAQHAGMMWELEQVTRREAFKAAAGWPSGVHLFMNCSPQVFADERFADQVRHSIDETPGLAPSRIVLEITERSEQEHVEGLSRQVGLLKEAGFQIAIDDVGAGTSGLNRIMRLRPHWLKLDRNLIEAIDKDRVKQNLIRFMVHFSRLSGVKMIAEGVERAEELATLLDLGVAFAQGFYLGRPGSRDQALSPGLVDWLQRQWSNAHSRRLSTTGHGIARLVRPARTVDAAVPVAEVAAALERNAETGVIVTQESRYVGWADREWVLERARAEQAGYPIGSLLGPGTPAISTDESLTEILDQMSSRSGRAASHPLVVVDSGSIVGIVPVSDVLSTAAELVRNPLTRNGSITGLPGRVAADEHIAQLIAVTPSSRPSERRDAAVIDIRLFADYNGTYGYELGDQLLRAVAATLRDVILGDDPGVFVAHIGDDRFFITAKHGGLMHRFDELAERFEAAAQTLSAAPVSALPEPASVEPHRTTPPHVGLRIVLVPDVTSSVADARDLFRFANRLRESVDAGGPGVIPLGRNSAMIRATGEAHALRLSA